MRKHFCVSVWLSYRTPHTHEAIAGERTNEGLTQTRTKEIGRKLIPNGEESMRMNREGADVGTFELPRLISCPNEEKLQRPPLEVNPDSVYCYSRGVEHETRRIPFI